MASAPSATAGSTSRCATRSRSSTPTAASPRRAAAPPSTSSSPPTPTSPGEWQSYTIAFRQPRWNGDKKTENARISVVHNGVVVHDNVDVPRKTGHGQKEAPGPGPLRLQHHGNPVVFRNIWLLPLAPNADPEGTLKTLVTPVP